MTKRFVFYTHSDYADPFKTFYIHGYSHTGKQPAWHDVHYLLMFLVSKSCHVKNFGTRGLSVLMREVFHLTYLL